MLTISYSHSFHTNHFGVYPAHVRTRLGYEVKAPSNTVPETDGGIHVPYDGETVGTTS
jgi:hypothetical protein